MRKDYWNNTSLHESRVARQSTAGAEGLRSQQRMALVDWAYLVGTATRNLLHLRRETRGPVRSILALCMGGIGNVLWFTPVLRSLRARHSRATIVVLVMQDRGTKQILEGSPYVDECITVGWNPRAIPKGLARLLRLLRGRHFDMTVSTHPGVGLGGRLLAYMIGAPIRAGYEGLGSRFLLTVAAPLNRRQHVLETNLDLARAMGLEVADTSFDLPLEKQDRAFAIDFLRQKGVSARDTLVGIHPGTFPDLREKSWPPDQFAQLIDDLQRNAGVKVILFGGPQDEVAVRHILSYLLGDPPLLATDLTLRQMAALFQRCRLLITNDSGPLRVAEAVDTPAVALFGPTDPALVGPYGRRDGRYVVIRKGVPCGPCYQYRRINCPYDTECMRLITSEEVAEAARECLRSQSEGDGVADHSPPLGDPKHVKV